MKIIKITAALLFMLPLFAGDDWWQVFFTHPQSKTGVTDVTPEKALVKTINEAKVSFYGAFYDIGSVPVTNAILAAKKRGVDIRLVTDDSNYNKPQVSRLEAAGITVVSDANKGLMHNKFAVIDDEKVWTGSYNITENGENKNNNNAILIRSPELAGIYLARFKDMFELKNFGNRKKNKPFGGITQKYYVKIGDTNINAYFAPDDNVENIIIGRIKNAKNSIRFMAFSFTSAPIAEAMIMKFKEGVAVSGVFERKGSDTKESQFTKMKVEGVPVRLDGNRYSMHHKVIIIDDYRLITGSYNFSKNASRINDENCIMIDNAAISALYVREFENIFKIGKEK